MICAACRVPRRRRSQQPLAQHRAVPAPQLAEVDQPVARLRQRHAEERRRAARRERHRHDVPLFRGVDHRGRRARAGKHGAADAVDGRVLRAVVGAELVLVQIDHQAHVAARHAPLQPGRRRVAHVEADRSDERREQR
jgi:hypothetical protein